MQLAKLLTYSRSGLDWRYIKMPDIFILYKARDTVFTPLQENRENCNIRENQGFNFQDKVLSSMPNVIKKVWPSIYLCSRFRLICPYCLVKVN